MKKKIVVICSLFLIGMSFLLYFCFSIDKNMEEKIYKEIHEAISSHRKHISFDSIDEDSDSLIIITPYTRINELEDTLQIDCFRIKHLNMEMRDDKYVLLFIKHRQIQSAATIRADIYSFQVNSFRVYPKNYKFHISRVSFGKTQEILINE